MWPSPGCDELHSAFQSFRTQLTQDARHCERSIDRGGARTPPSNQYHPLSSSVDSVCLAMCCAETFHFEMRCNGLVGGRRFSLLDSYLQDLPPEIDREIRQGTEKAALQKIPTSRAIDFEMLIHQASEKEVWQAMVVKPTILTTCTISPLSGPTCS